tara:strand:+ start:4543 stop:5019 length:477 start_codon:yes stop_codon:yes gene_type:complete
VAASLVIRNATAADIPMLQDIEGSSFPSDHISKRQFNYFLKKAKARTFVALVDSVVSGYGIVLLPARRNYARLYSLAVAKNMRGVGIGDRLLTAVDQAVENMGYSALGLEVRVSSVGVRRLYEKHGFVVCCVLSGYYGDGEDGLKMKKQMGSSDTKKS